MREWAVETTSARALAGDVTFAITNFGTMKHEFLVVKTDFEPGKIPLTSDFHTNFHRYAEHYGAALVGRSIAAYLRWLHNRTACTVVPTQEMKQELDNLGFERVLLAGRERGHDDV